ncbi:hypothetical protein ALI22I_26815 [Saccharothrix sp. ALI-22-I]|nr:hypothetical protein ALI22I_26815 [Saccharothrix sp. ALI-22-I]
MAFHPAARPPAPAPVPRRPERRRRNRFARRPDLVRIACWQLAVVAVARALGEPWPTLLATTLAALAVLALTAIRVRGRLLGEIAVRACCFPLRARRRDLPAESRSEALIALLLPGSTVRTVQTGPGPVLVISHPGGLTAVVRPRADHPVAPLPTPAALLPAAKEQRHSFGVQAVLHVGVRRDAPPRVWFAVHVDRTVEAPDDDELTVALRNGLRRVRRVLARAGVPADGLPEEAALAAVAALGHVTGGRHEIRADWRYWRTGPVSQACYRLDGWDRVHEGIRWRLAHDLLTRTAGVAATVTFGARTGAATGAVLRLAATTEAAVERAAAVVGDLCGHFDVHLVRLDGAHVSGVAASLPIGGFLP